jgi:PAS domain S-box-containing protein
MNSDRLPRAVLVVEDDRAMAELERRTLVRAGFAPLIANSVAEAQERLTGGGFAVVLLDYNLPDGDAWHLVTQARGMRPRVPVIMVTAMGSESVAADAIRRGVAAYIVKGDRFIDGLGAAVDSAARLADADEEMHRNNSLFRAIADNAHDAIVLLDGAGTILFASMAAEQMLGEPPAALIGRRLADFIGSEDGTEGPEGDAPHRDGPRGGATHGGGRDGDGRDGDGRDGDGRDGDGRDGDGRDGDGRDDDGRDGNGRPNGAQGSGAAPRAGAARRVYRVRHNDGAMVSVEPTFATIGRGEATRTLGVLRDVTERVRLEERVRHKERMEAIGHLTGGLAHDFNNLLGVVIGNLDLLQDEVGISEATRELAHDALDAALRGAELTRGLLAFARRQDLRPTHADVNASVEAVVRLLSRVLGADIAVELSLAEDVWPVLVDRVQLETALTNLIANARDAMPRGGWLVIATGNTHLDADCGEAGTDLAPGDYATIEVRDNGQGMTPAVLDRIFEPFYTTKEPGRGTGLGLAMVFGFIRQSGGHIHAWSELGRGTSFRLYLPRVSATAACAARPAKALDAPAAPVGDGRTILVVEDNDRLRELTVRQLGAARYRVLAAEGAAAALAVLESEVPIDLLFTDIVMAGGIDGVELARRAVARRPTLKVLLTSGFPDRLGERDSARRGPHSLLPKPYRVGALLGAVGAALG